MSDHRQRIHELVVALLTRQSELELLDAEGAAFGGVLRGSDRGGDSDPGCWLERNRRIVRYYQALVRSAVTLDALIDQEVGGDRLTGGSFGESRSSEDQTS